MSEVPPPVPPPRTDHSCPNCGQPVMPMTAHCPRCGYTFRATRQGMPTVLKALLIAAGTVVALVVLAFGACVIILSTAGH